MSCICSVTVSSMHCFQTNRKTKPLNWCALKFRIWLNIYGSSILVHRPVLLRNFKNWHFQFQNWVNYRGMAEQQLARVAKYVTLTSSNDIRTTLECRHLFSSNRATVHQRRIFSIHLWFICTERTLLILYGRMFTWWNVILTTRE